MPASNSLRASEYTSTYSALPDTCSGAALSRTGTSPHTSLPTDRLDTVARRYASSERCPGREACP